MQPSTCARRRIGTLILLLSLSLLAQSPAQAFDSSRFTPEYLDQVTNCDSANFIIVCMTESSGLVVGESGLMSEIDKSTQAVPASLTDALTWRGSVLELKRLFPGSVEDFSARKMALEAKGETSVPDLNRFALVRTPEGKALKGDDLKELLNRINADPAVSIAYPRPFYQVASFEDEPVRQDGAAKTVTPDFQHLQTYRGYPFQNGLGADAVETWAGSQGDHVKIIDIEGGWLWDHEDLPTPFLQIGTSDPGTTYHGTAVMGVIAGADNGFGVKGFVPNAQVGGIVSEVAWDDPLNWNDCSEEIIQATSNLDAGDLILIELMAKVDLEDSSEPWLPLEYWYANFEAMRLATLEGIVVVEASGNSSANLDSYFTLFVRDDPILDCGAVMVGGFNPETEQAAMNWGDRVDVHAWSGQVTTTGSGSLFGTAEGLPSTRHYRDSFGGTSSASAIVTGVVGSIQSINIEETGLPVDARVLRTRLIASGHFVDGVSNQVGPRPDISEFFRFYNDTGAPDAVSNLNGTFATSNTVTLVWSAPADDYRDMIVAGYDLRYSQSPITESNFESATAVEDVMEPWRPGLIQGAEVLGLLPSTTYYLALKSYDPAGHYSPISNVVTMITDPPAPQVSWTDGQESHLGKYLLNHSTAGEFSVENTGSADLLILNAATLPIPNLDIQVVGLPLSIPAGETGVFSLALTPQVLGEVSGYIAITTNDPDQPVAVKTISVTSVDLQFSDSYTAAPLGVAVDGVVEVSNPSNTQVSYSVAQPRIVYDLSHGQSVSTTYAYIYPVHGETFEQGGVTNLTSADLANAEVFYVGGSPAAWTAGEIQLVVDWVNAGGGLYLETDFAPGQDQNLNPLLSALGLGTPLEYGLDVNLYGLTTQLSGDDLLDGVTEMTLSNLFYKLNSIPAGADWLIKTPNGLEEKAFKANVGAGRVIMCADHLYNSPTLVQAHEVFADNAFRWLADFPTWLDYGNMPASIPAMSDISLPVTVDPGSLPVGVYTYQTEAEVLGCALPFTITMEVVAAEISGLDKVYLNAAETKFEWTTNVSLPCRFRYREYGAPVWSSPVTLAAGTEHSITVATVPNQRYDGWIEIMADDNPVVESIFVFKTLRIYMPKSGGAGESDLPAVTALAGAAPNPFNPTTAISFSIAETQHVRLDVYDIRGRHVRSLMDTSKSAGNYEVFWDGTDGNGRRLESGVYFVKMAGRDYQKVEKMTLVK